jgi:RNA polymerase sigma-70 factor (ECF subfamily)
VNPPDHNDRDVELLRRIAVGDRKAFAEFYDRHAALMYSVACKILGDNAEAQDVVQEVCLQLWEKSARFDPKLGKVASWAAIMTRNRAVDRLRASQRRTRLADAAEREQMALGDAPDSVNDLLYGRDRASRIQSAILALPAEQRLAIQLAYFSGLTQEEISQKLGAPLGTVKARIRRGLLKLRDQLEELK